MSIYLVLFFMGLVQGLTEFLPVSSSGHLVLLSKLFNIEESLFISILLHLATLLSIVVVFYKDIWELIRHPFSKKTITLVLATIPTCIIVLILMPLIKSSFNGLLLPLCFIISAILLFSTEYLTKKKVGRAVDNKIAVIMGIAQGFAVFPGISRSGTTICAGLLADGDKKDTTKFSFLMSIPIILLSMVMEIYEICVGNIEINFPIASIIIAFIIAFLSGIFAIKFMMKLTEKANLKWFALYLVLFGFTTFFIV